MSTAAPKTDSTPTGNASSGVAAVPAGLTDEERNYVIAHCPDMCLKVLARLEEILLEIRAIPIKWVEPGHHLTKRAIMVGMCSAPDAIAKRICAEYAQMVQNYGAGALLVSLGNVGLRSVDIRFGAYFASGTDSGAAKPLRAAKPLPGDVMLRFTERYPWLTVKYIAAIEDVISSLGDKKVKWIDEAVPDGFALSLHPSFISSGILSAYSEAAKHTERALCISMSLNWMDDSLGMKLGFVVAVDDSEPVQGASAAVAVTADAAGPVVSVMDSAAKQTIDDIVALYPNLGAAETLKLVRMHEALATPGKSPVRWVKDRAPNTFIRDLNFSTASLWSIDSSLTSRWSVCVRAGMTHLVLMLHRAHLDDQWTLYYTGSCDGNVLRGDAIVGAKDMISRYPFLDAPALVVAGQIDTLLVGVPRRWVPTVEDTRNSISIGASPREAAAAIRRHYDDAPEDCCVLLAWHDTGRICLSLVKA